MDVISTAGEKFHFLASIPRKHFPNPLSSSGIVKEVKVGFE